MFSMLDPGDWRAVWGSVGSLLSVPTGPLHQVGLLSDFWIMAHPNNGLLGGVTTQPNGPNAFKVQGSKTCVLGSTSPTGVA